MIKFYLSSVKMPLGKISSRRPTEFLVVVKDHFGVGCPFVSMHCFYWLINTHALAYERTDYSQARDPAEIQVKKYAVKRDPSETPKQQDVLENM